jgi:Tol biopolymer transport system component
MRHPSTHPRVRLVVAALLLTACAKEPQTLTKPDFAVRYAAAANLSEWSPATSLTEINTDSTDGCPFIAKSGNVLYFASNRAGAGGYGKLDLYVSHWDDAAKEWGTPTNMGPGINTADNEQCPLVLNSGKELIFASDRKSGGAGGLDLWLADRRDHRNDLGWQSPVNLTALNTSAAEFGPGAYEEEDGTTVLYFNSNRSGQHDLYVSTRSPGGTFLPPVPAAGLNTPDHQEEYASLSKDGREIFFSSDRPVGQGGLDLWHASRESTSDLWDAPVNLGPAVNSTATEGRSAIAWDGMTLIFNSNRAGSVAGSMDLYQTTRTRLTGRRN